MAAGPFVSIDACLADPKMGAAYPDEATRRKVCGSLEAASDSGNVAAQDAAHLAARVVEHDAFWLVSGNVAAREGVNSRGEFKPFEELAADAAMRTLEGAPFIWGHPPARTGDPYPWVRDRKEAAGAVVNVRVDASTRSLVYDVALWKRAPDGWRTPAADVERNLAAVALLRRGVAIHNSAGYVHRRDPLQGAIRAHDGVPFTVEQRGILFDHVAGLAPVFGASSGACSVQDGCGLAVAADADCAHEGGCCKDRAATAAATIADTHGVTLDVAYSVLAAGAKV